MGNPETVNMYLQQFNIAAESIRPLGLPLDIMEFYILAYADLQTILTLGVMYRRVREIISPDNDAFWHAFFRRACLSNSTRWRQAKKKQVAATRSPSPFDWVMYVTVGGDRAKLTVPRGFPEKDVESSVVVAPKFVGPMPSASATFAAPPPTAHAPCGPERRRFIEFATKLVGNLTNEQASCHHPVVEPTPAGYFRCAVCRLQIDFGIR